MMTRNRITNVLTVAVAGLVLALAVSAEAAIVKAEVNSGISGDDTAYDGNVSTTDLINSGSSTLGSYTASAAEIGTPQGSVHAGTPGTSGNAGSYGYWVAGTGVTLTYTLAGSVTGYDITSINTIYGWKDGAMRYTAQKYDVLISTVSTPAFTALTSVDYAPFTNNPEASSQVSLTDTTGVLASGVTGIRFIISPTSTSPEVGIIHEYDVFGTATVPAAVPEPSTTALLGLGGLALILRRRK